jgi:hypothetical protein
MAPKAKGPEVLIDGKREYPDGPDMTKYAGGALVAIGLLMTVATLVDLGVLWLTQRAPNINWEFAALQSTASDGFFNLTVASGFMFAGLGLRRSTPVSAYRLLAAFLLLLGIGAFAVGGFAVTNYFALVSVAGVDEAALSTVRGAALKVGLISAANCALFTILGILGFRAKGQK